MPLFRCRRDAKALFSISNGFLRSHHSVLYSTISSNSDEAPKMHFMVDYLMNSLGFSRGGAISTWNKVKKIKSTENADLVVNIFKEYGLEKSQIREIVSSVPKVLSYKGNKTLEPKIRVLMKLGLSGSDLVKVIKKNPSCLSVGLDTRLIPIIDNLRKILGSDEKVIFVLNRCSWLFQCNSLGRFSANIILLQNHGLSDEEITSFITRKPRIITQNPAFLEGQLRWIVGELGIPENSSMFIRAIYGVSMSSQSTLAKKFNIFRSYGWSDHEIITFGRTQPSCLALSEAKLCNGLNFFMKELGYMPAFLASCPSLLAMSMEKRVKPRYIIWKSLNEKKLVRNSPSFATLLSHSELKFLEFLKRFENEISNLRETYINSVRKTPS